VERGKIVFENGSENYQEAEKELDKNIAKALRQIEQRNAGLTLLANSMWPSRSRLRSEQTLPPLSQNTWR
jgi:hypothetical protein